MNRPGIILLFCLIFLASLACSVPALGGPKATATAAPTDTPAPAATAEPQPSDDAANQVSTAPGVSTGGEGIVVIADASYRIDDWDYIVGIVQNNTADTIEWLELSVLVYDANDTLISTESVYPFLDKLAPGESSPFSVNSDAWAQGATYDFLVEDYDIAEDPVATGIEILSHNSYNDEYSLNLVGEIQNNSDRPMSFVRVAAALYAPDGSLINTNYSFTMLNYLLPGQKSPFKIWFSDNWEDGDTYEIQVQGDYDETAPAQVVQIVNQQVTASDGICTVTGNAKNTGSTNLTYATVIAAFYDSQNTLLEAEWSFTDGDSLPAGASAAFTITSYSCPEYDHVEVFAGN